MTENTDAEESAPGTAVESPAPAEEKKKGGKLKYVALAGLALSGLAVGAYVLTSKNDGDSGAGDAGTYNSVAPVIVDDQTSPAYDRAADEIIEEIAEEEGISLEDETGTTEPTTPEYLTNPLSGRQETYNPELDRNGDGIQDTWIHDDGTVYAEDRNHDGKLDHEFNEGVVRAIGESISKHDLERDGIGELADMYPGIYRIDMEQWDDNYDGSFDRVAMTFHYGGGEDRKEFKYEEDRPWQGYAYEVIHPR